MPPHRHPAGFTLLELLVAMTIFAIMSVLIYGGLISVARARETLTAQSNHLGQVQMVFTMMQRDLESALPYPIMSDDAAESELATFRGHSEEAIFLNFLRLHSSMGVTDFPSPLERVQYRLENQAILRTSWNVSNPSQDQPSFPMMLVSDVVQLRIRFLDSKKSWDSHWKRTTLPLMMELTLTTKNGEQFIRQFRITG